MHNAPLKDTIYSKLIKRRKFSAKPLKKTLTVQRKANERSIHGKVV